MPNGVGRTSSTPRGSARAIDILLKKLAGKEFVTEFPMPDFDRVAPNPLSRTSPMLPSLW